MTLRLALSWQILAATANVCYFEHHVYVWPMPYALMVRLCHIKRPHGPRSPGATIGVGSGGIWEGGPRLDYGPVQHSGIALDAAFSCSYSPLERLQRAEVPLGPSLHSASFVLGAQEY